METYHKIQTLFKRDLDGSITGQKGKMLEGQWTTPELEYLSDKEWEFTEKVDGTNIRIGYYQDGEVLQFRGRTDRAVLPKPLTGYLEETFTPYLFEKAGLNQDPVILFGEGYGAGIQSGGNYRDDQSFVLFDVKIGPWWLDREDVDDIASKLGIDSVPVIGRGSLWNGIDIVKNGVGTLSVGQDDKAYIRFGPGHLKSHWGQFEAEGLVARPVVPLFNRKGERIITKIKARDFR